MPKLPKKSPSISKEEIEYLFEEIKMSEKIIDVDLVPKLQEALQRYTGRWVPAHTEEWNVNLNTAYPNVQVLMHGTFMNNPKIYAKPTNKNFIMEIGRA